MKEVATAAMVAVMEAAEVVVVVDTIPTSLATGMAAGRLEVVAKAAGPTPLRQRVARRSPRLRTRLLHPRSAVLKSNPRFLPLRVSRLTRTRCRLNWATTLSAREIRIIFFNIPSMGRERG